MASGASLLLPARTRELVERFAAPAAGGAADPRIAQLTEPELEVLLAVASGRSNAEIAEQMFLGVATIQTHLARVLSKLGLASRTQAVVFAYESGLVRPGSAD